MDRTPFLIADIDALRRDILDLETREGKRADLWRLLKSSARGDPMAFGWYTPFVALITRAAGDIENARRIVFTYMDKLDPMEFCSGLQFHFWCFAFPHAKMSLYFQWLCGIGAFSPEEEHDIAARLVAYHFLHFYYGMRTKPEPECVDNQALSLALSNAIVGHLFARTPGLEGMASLMLRDGLRRLPSVIGGMPASGYSGEGSAYMDCVNGPAIPLTVEVLEAITGEGGLLFKELPPSGVRPIKVLQMVARAFMPGGLLLPWDNYGYQLGVRSAVSYAAMKTDEDLYRRVLEDACTFTYDIGIGWAYDDLVWTLIWWPPYAGGRSGDDGANWFEPAAGGALVSADHTKYAFQMWDESAPGIPTRAHVNPNAVLLNGYGVPLSADGSPAPGKPHRFQFPDTWRTVHHLIGEETRYNYGDGCGGGHSIVLVDGMESLRAHSEYPQVSAAAYDAQDHAVWADVTPLYRENFPDVRMVSRRTQLHGDAFFTIEDLFVAEARHRVVSRFLLRPSPLPCDNGALIQTPEGVTLHLLDLLQPGPAEVSTVENHPYLPDGRSILVDFSGFGSTLRRLFVAFIANTLAFPEPLLDWTAIPDPEGCLSPEEARDRLSRSGLVLPLRLPAYMERALEPCRTWWYRRTAARRPGPGALKLPAGIFSAYGAPFCPRLFICGREIDLSPFALSGQLIPPRIVLPDDLCRHAELDILLRVDVPTSHYDGKSDGTVGMWGGVWLGGPVEPERLVRAAYRDGHIEVETDRRALRIPYELLSGVKP